MNTNYRLLYVAALALVIGTSAALADSELRCNKPGETVQVDDANDQGALGTTAHDVLRLGVAEPFTVAGVDNLTFIIDVQTLDPLNPQLATIWYVRFMTPNGTEWFLSAETCDATQIPSFGYGTFDVTLGFQRIGDTTGQLQTNSICIDITSAVLEASNPAGGFTGGTVLSNVFADVRVFGGAQCSGLVSQVDATAPVGVTLCGSEACAPIATEATTWGSVKALW